MPIIHAIDIIVCIFFFSSEEVIGAKLNGAIFVDLVGLCSVLVTFSYNEY